MSSNGHIAKVAGVWIFGPTSRGIISGSTRALGNLTREGIHESYDSGTIAPKTPRDYRGYPEQCMLAFLLCVKLRFAHLFLIYPQAQQRQG